MSLNRGPTFPIPPLNNPPLNSHSTLAGQVEDAYDKEKHELNGVKYDHVIDVDVEDGKPALKLGVNKEDDPWVVAQNFISTHMLPQAYLEQIANYITQNTGVGPKPMELDSEYCDPLTGGSRYIPPSVSSGGTSSMPQTRFFPNSTLVTETVDHQEPIDKHKQPIITRYLGHVTGY
eukprot:sb/3471901/